MDRHAAGLQALLIRLGPSSAMNFSARLIWSPNRKPLAAMLLIESLAFRHLPSRESAEPVSNHFREDP